MKKTTIKKLEDLHNHAEFLEIKKGLIVMVSKTANMKLFYEKVLEDPEASERAKQLAKVELETRGYGKLEEEYDRDVAKQLDDWMEKKILEMVHNKELPKSKFVGLIKKYKQITKHESKRSSTGDDREVREGLGSE